MLPDLVSLNSTSIGSVSEHKEQFKNNCQDTQKVLIFDLVILIVEFWLKKAEPLVISVKKSNII